MARPKSVKPIKNKTISGRLTEVDYMKIKKLYGSIQAFLDLMVKTLPILILVSCNGAEAPMETKTKKQSISPEIVYEVDTKMYAKVNYNLNYFGYDLDVKCTEMQCFVTGKMYEWKNDQGSVYVSTIKAGVFLERHGDYAYGEICIDSYTKCYEATVNISNFLAIAESGRCHKAQVNSNESELDQALDGLVYYSSYPTLENSISSSECNY